MGVQVDCKLATWFAASPEAPTAAERVRLIARLLANDGRLAEIVVYSHGTAVARLRSATKTADEIMAAYDMPGDGEGSPFGDIHPVPFDDDSVLFGWPMIDADGGALSILTHDELSATDPVLSPTEVMRTETPAEMFVLRGGLEARARRGRDARSRIRKAWWIAPVS